MSSNVTVDRLQFSLLITFQYLFPILTMGVGLFVAWLESVSYLGRESHRLRPLRRTEADRDQYESAARFWAKIFAVNFAVGVVTGIPMEFQFRSSPPGPPRSQPGRRGRRGRAREHRLVLLSGGDDRHVRGAGRLRPGDRRHAPDPGPDRGGARAGDRHHRTGVERQRGVADRLGRGAVLHLGGTPARSAASIWA